MDTTSPSAPRSVRFKAAGIHLAICLAIAAAVAALVFGLWYPQPYAKLLGGTSIFLLILAVDITLGPLLTLIVTTPGKARGPLLFDYTIIGLCQIAALAYGLYAIGLGRPVYTVYAVDRFNVVTAADLDAKDLGEAKLPEYRSLSWTGPRLVAAIPPQERDEMLRMIELAAAGRDVQFFPKYYAPLAAVRGDMQTHGLTPTALKRRNAQAAEAVQRRLAELGIGDTSKLRYFPLLARAGDATAIVDITEPKLLAIVPVAVYD